MRRGQRLWVAIASACTLSSGVLLLASSAGATPTAWKVTASPTRDGGADQLNAISCVGPTFCTAVGWYNGGAGTLTETWNGHRWSLRRSPNPGGDPDQLSAVSCTSSRFCVAVGDHSTTSGGEATVVETWNGYRWTLNKSPSPGGDSVLAGVSCTSDTDCEAVGSHNVASAAQNAVLVERWDGHSWSVVPSPTGRRIDTEFRAVSCRTARTCTAVGDYEDTFGLATLIESWNGQRWSIVSSPNHAIDGNNTLHGVSCSAASCEAVGYFNVGLGPQRTLVESWHGTKWSIATSRDVGTKSNALASVSCTSSTNCVAVGYRQFDTADDKTLVESWNGTMWSITSSPNPTTDQKLLGVVCTSESGCEAVGYHGVGPLLSDKTLVETGT